MRSTLNDKSEVSYQTFAHTELTVAPPAAPALTVGKYNCCELLELRCGRETSWYIFLCFMSAFTCALLALTVQVEYQTGISTVELIVVTALLQILPMACIVSYQKIPKEEVLNNMAVGGFNALSGATYFMALGLAPPGNVGVVFSTMTIFIVPFSRCILGELTKKTYPFVIVSTLAGLILIVRPPFIFGQSGQSGDYEYLGYAFSFISMFFWIFQTVFAIKFQTNAYAVTLFRSITLSVGGIIYSFLSGATHRAIAELPWTLLCLHAFVGAATVALYFQSSKHLSSQISILVYLTNTPMIYIFEAIFFYQIYSPMVYSGALLVLLTVAFYILVDDASFFRCFKRKSEEKHVSEVEVEPFLSKVVEDPKYDVLYSRKEKMQQTLAA